MVDSDAFHLTVDAIGSLERDAIHEIGSHASPSTYRSRIALTFFKPTVIGNFNTECNKCPVSIECFFFLTPDHTPLFYRLFFIATYLSVEIFTFTSLDSYITRLRARLIRLAADIKTKTNDVFIVFLEN